MEEFGVRWSDREVLELLSIWGDKNVQNHLKRTFRNHNIFEDISDALRERGVMKTAEQCRLKIKKFKSKYRSIKDQYSAGNNDGNQAYPRRLWQYYNIMDQIMTENLPTRRAVDSLRATLMRKIYPPAYGGGYSNNWPSPKDGVGPGEVSWPATNSASSPAPGPSRKSADSRPSTSTAPSSYIKPDPGTPPPMIMAPLNPYIQEPQLAPQLGPRLLPKPIVQQQQQPPQQQQMRLRMRPIAPAPPPPPPQLPEPDSEPQQVCLRWNSFHSNMQTMFPSLLTREKFVDVTLACEGRSIKCHKVVLSSCSAYLERLLSENPCKHPIILMPRDLRFWELRALVDFMYRGEVNVEHEQLPSLLAAAEALQVKGLAGPASSLPPDPPDDPPDPPSSPRAKRKRVSSPPPVQHAPPHRPPQQQHKTPQLPNSPSVSITRLVPRSAAPSTSHQQPPVTLPTSSQESQNRVHSPGIEITPVVSFEEIKVEPIDISDSNDESMDPMDVNQDYDMDPMDKDYPDDEIEDREDIAGGQEDEPPDPITEPLNSDPQSLNANGTHDSTDNETEAVESTPDFEGNGVDFDGARPDPNYASAELGLRTEPPDIDNPPPDIDTS